MRFNFRSIKTQLIVFLSFFAFLLLAESRDLLFLKAIIIAVISALVLDSIFIFVKNKEFRISESSIITGLIIGLVLAAGQSWWKIPLSSLIAISSKHLVKIKGKHIFNPAACGIFLSVILFGASTQWSGTYLWYILVPFGLYFAQKIKKTEVVIGYAVLSLLLFGGQAISRGIPLKNIFGYFSYFYIFIMVIEPVTSPINRQAKYLFGAGIAVLIFILTEAGAAFDAELASLLVMDAAAPLLNRVSLRKGA